MGAKSRRKGASGEREVAAVATALGIRARRTAPMQAGYGSSDDADVSIELVGLPLYLECKRYKRTPVARFARKLFAEERPGFVPVLAYRDDQQDAWHAVVPLAELLKLCRELSDRRAHMRPTIEDDLSEFAASRVSLDARKDTSPAVCGKAGHSQSGRVA